MKKPVKLLRIIKGSLGILLALALAAVCAVAIIMGQPQNDLQTTRETAQPLLQASPARSAGAEDDIAALCGGYPIPVLLCPTEDLALLSGMAYDTAFENGFARIIQLKYADPDGTEITVGSIYPGRAVTLLSDASLTLTGEGPEIAGCISARMTGGQTVRLHIQTEQGLYYVQCDAQNEPAMNDALKSLQLISFPAETVQE